MRSVGVRLEADTKSGRIVGDWSFASWRAKNRGPAKLRRQFATAAG